MLSNFFSYIQEDSFKNLGDLEKNTFLCDKYIRLLIKLLAEVHYNIRNNLIYKRFRRYRSRWCVVRLTGFMGDRPRGNGGGGGGGGCIMYMLMYGRPMDIFIFAYRTLLTTDSPHKQIKADKEKRSPKGPGVFLIVSK